MIFLPILFFVFGLQADFFGSTESSFVSESYASTLNKQDEISLRISAAGYSKDDLKVIYTDKGHLYVQVKMVDQKPESKGKKASCSDYTFTTVFSRHFPRLCKKNIQSCSAQTKDGILSIKIELKKEETHEIKVEG